MKRIRVSDRTSSSDTSPKYIRSSSSFSSAESSWLTEKFARSKKRSPIPAYSQSTIQMRSPSVMKFAFRRSLWQGAGGCEPRACSIRSATSFAVVYSAGTETPCVVAVAQYASTTRNESKRPGIAGPSCRRRSPPAISRRAVVVRTSSTAPGGPPRSASPGSPPARRTRSPPARARRRPPPASPHARCRGRCRAAPCPCRRSGARPGRRRGASP